MNELKLRIHDDANGLDYVLAGDYHIPIIELPEEDDRPIGKWGRSTGRIGENEPAFAEPPDFDGQAAHLPC